MEWQPIETAPKVGEKCAPGSEGPVIILGNQYGSWVGVHHPIYTSGFKPENPWFCKMLNVLHMPKRDLMPTHWMPLPSPPERET